MITFSTLTSHNNQQSKTGSSPRCPIWFHYLVNSKNNSYFVGIGPICDIELTCIFWLVFLFVRCIKYRSQYYKIVFNTHLFSDVFIMTLNYVLCPILVQNLEKCTFSGYISILPASTHRYKKHQRSTSLPLYLLHTEKIERRSFIGGWLIVVREIATLI